MATTTASVSRNFFQEPAPASFSKQLHFSFTKSLRNYVAYLRSTSSSAAVMNDDFLAFMKALGNSTQGAVNQEIANFLCPPTRKSPKEATKQECLRMLDNMTNLYHQLCRLYLKMAHRIASSRIPVEKFPSMTQNFLPGVLSVLGQNSTLNKIGETPEILDNEAITLNIVQTSIYNVLNFCLPITDYIRDVESFNDDMRSVMSQSTEFMSYGSKSKGRNSSGRRAPAVEDYLQQPQQPEPPLAQAPRQHIQTPYRNAPSQHHPPRNSRVWGSTPAEYDAAHCAPQEQATSSQRSSLAHITSMPPLGVDDSMSQASRRGTDPHTLPMQAPRGNVYAPTTQTAYARPPSQTQPPSSLPQRPQAHQESKSMPSAPRPVSQPRIDEQPWTMEKSAVQPDEMQHEHLVTDSHDMQAPPSTFRMSSDTMSRRSRTSQRSRASVAKSMNSLRSRQSMPRVKAVAPQAPSNSRTSRDEVQSQSSTKSVTVSESGQAPAAEVQVEAEYSRDPETNESGRVVAMPTHLPTNVQEEVLTSVDNVKAAEH